MLCFAYLHRALMSPDVNSHWSWHRQRYRLFPAGRWLTCLSTISRFSIYYRYIFFGLSLLNVHLGPGEAACSAGSSFHSRSSKTPVKTCPTDSAALLAILSEDLNISVENRHWRTWRLLCGLCNWNTKETQKTLEVVCYLHLYEFVQTFLN